MKFSPIAVWRSSTSSGPGSPSSTSSQLRTSGSAGLVNANRVRHRPPLRSGPCRTRRTYGAGRGAPRRIAHLDAVGEVLAPASLHGACRLVVAEQLVGKPGLEPRVDHDRRRVERWLRSTRTVGGVDVRRRLEAGEGRPEEVDRAGGGASPARRSARSAASRRSRRARRSSAGPVLVFEARPPTTRQPGQKTRARRRSGASPRRWNSRGSSRTGSPRPSQTPFEPSFTFGPGVVQGVHREVGEDVEIGLRVRALQQMLQRRPEVAQIDRAGR